MSKLGDGIHPTVGGIAPPLTPEQEREVRRLVKIELDLIASRLANALRGFAGEANL